MKHWHNLINVYFSTTIQKTTTLRKVVLFVRLNLLICHDSLSKNDKFANLQNYKFHDNWHLWHNMTLIFSCVNNLLYTFIQKRIKQITYGHFKNLLLLQFWLNSVETSGLTVSTKMENSFHLLRNVSSFKKSDGLCTGIRSSLQ